MILAMIRMSCGDNHQVCMALRTLCDITAGRPGCRGCQVLRQLDCPERLLYIEHWDDWSSLRAHLNSETYAHLLQILELSAERPEVEFREVSESRGLEFVEEVRLGRHAEFANGRAHPGLSSVQVKD